MNTQRQACSIDENARLEELYALQILDTPREARFDQYTQLVADILDVPIVLVSLLAEQRQWFKSAVGTELTQTPREVSFCDHALGKGYLEIPDARNDARFVDSPLVTAAPHLRFYAGCVLYGPTGQPLGTLCVLDTQPRCLSASRRSQLKAFAKLVEQELYEHERLKMRVYDPVTGLAEREIVEQHLSRWLDAAGDTPQPLAVVHLQLSNFDALTALAGYREVNAMVQTLAERLRHKVRSGDRIGRLGPDRFCVVMPGCDDSTDIAARVDALVADLSAPVRLGHVDRPVLLAAGISRYPEDAKNVGDLLTHARMAAADTSGEDTVHFYAQAEHARVSRRHDLVDRLRAALAQQRLSQVYQPVVASADGRLIGVEALARWHDPVYEHVSPGEFIPLCEADPAMSRALTHWSLERACSQLAAWRGQFDGSFRVAVNIPGRELYRRDFPAQVKDLLRRYAIAPQRLVLELTEQSLITDIASAVASMEALRAIGVRFAVDDFGTGYSSLGYLQRLPLDSLKIDRGFIRDIATDPKTRDMARCILDIARTLGLMVVAEGIEDAAQHAVLQAIGCDYEQGFWFGRPALPAQISERLRAARPGATPPRGVASPAPATERPVFMRCS